MQISRRRHTAMKEANATPSIPIMRQKSMERTMLETVSTIETMKVQVSSPSLKTISYMTSATGGTISLGVKYIPDDAQKLLFGLTDQTRSVTPQGGTSTSVAGLGVSAKSEGNYVGVAFYCPALKDSEKKFWCCRIVKAMFGPPSMSLQTKGENIVFNTPTTTGEMLMSDADDSLLYESAYVDTEAIAKAWVDASLTTV